jgi:hypothetical protein
MKKISFLVIVGLLVSTSACNKFVEDHDISPNNPGTATPSLLLANGQLAVYGTVHGQLARTSNILTQSLNGTDFQMVDVDEYTILEGDNNNEWQTIYNEGLDAINELINNHGDGNPYYMGMGKVLKAQLLAVATDFWGDVPATEAGNGLAGPEFLNPKYDAQADILTYIGTLLSDAKTAFGKAATDNKNVPGGDDLLFGGDVTGWSNYATLLQARYAMRLTKRNEAAAAAGALTALSGLGMTSNADDVVATYGTAGNELNPWAAFESNRGGYIRLGANLVDMMNADSDPRIASYALPDTGGIMRGSIVGENDGTASPIGTYTQGLSAPIATYVEAKFIEAEAKFRTADKAGAATAHNAAVLASVEAVTGDTASSAFKASTASETAGTITLETIMNQKYIALFGQIEVWADWRRTGFPTLSPNPNGKVTAIPRRLPTPFEERLYNTNAKVVQDILTPVWWDE